MKKEVNKWPILLLVAVLALVLCIVLMVGMLGDNKKPSGGNTNNPSTSVNGTQDTEKNTEGTEGINGTENTEGSSEVAGSEGMVQPEDGLGANDWTGGNNTEEVEKWQEGTITHNGKKYIYNNKIKTYLIMGIDREGKVEPAKNYHDGGQSDALFLLVANPENKTLSVVSINRNTMTRIATNYKNGASAGYKTAQICLQHAYGDGKTLSCTRAVDAVSHLFNNLPITGYLTLRMGAIPIINDSVGGVELTVIESINGMGANLTKGETKTLTGKEAYAYLRWRNKDKFDSATARLRREEQYISAFSSKLKSSTNGDVNKMVDIFESIDDYIVTNIDFAKLAEEITTYKYDSSRMYTVPGKMVMGEVYEEYEVDSKKLYDMIIDIFYKEV